MSRLSAWPASAPAKQNEEKEEARKALGLLGRLPPPYREIAALQYVHAWKRTAVTTVIRRWRPVGEEEARRLIRITHAMLRALGREDDIRRSWPEAFRTTRNPWLTTPLPRRWPLLGGPIRI